MASTEVGGFGFEALGFPFALIFLITPFVFITPVDISADFGSGSSASAIFGFVLLPRDFGLGGPKDSATPLAFGMEDAFPQPLPSWGGSEDAGPAIPSGCFCAGDLVFGPIDFDLCRSLAIVLTFVGGDGS